MKKINAQLYNLVMAGIKVGEVYSVEDPMCSGVIKVFMKGEDNSASLGTDGTKQNVTDKLFDAFPLLPKHLHVMPKVGELVFILTDDDMYSRRYYIGPIISQDMYLYEDLAMNASSALNGGELAESKPKYIGGVDNATVPHVVYPKTEHISIEGRRNCGLQLTDNDVMLKAGVKAVDPNKYDSISLNNDNTQAYILLRYNDSASTPSSATEFKSSATIVADKINLLGNRADFNFDMLDKDELITNDEMKNIVSQASQLPLGDKLIQFLQLFVSAFVHHTHPISTKEPVCLNTDVDKVKNFDLSTLLSKNVRIN